jgi:hypothetical protein
MTYANRTDSNQTEIVQALRKVGVSVQPLTAVKAGCPDLLCGYRGHNQLLEVKSDDGKLTPDQIDWKKNWRGSVCVVRNIEEAIKAVMV